MLPALASGFGSGMGAGLGQMAEGLDKPRQWAWQGIADLMGGGEAYGSGAELLSGLLGMDPESGLTQGLGIGAEMLLDPLTYAGGAIGKLGGMGVNALRGARTADKVGDAATMARRLEDMAGRGLDESILGAGINKARMSAGAQMPIAPFMDEVMPMRSFVNPESMASGATRSFKNPEPMLAEALEQMGLGKMNAAGNAIDVNAGLKSRVGMAGRPSGPSQAIPPSFAQPVSGNKPNNLIQRGNLPANFPSPDEMAMLRQQASAYGPEAIASIHGGVDPLKGVANSRYLATKEANLADALEEAAMGGLDFAQPAAFSQQVPGVPYGLMDKYGGELALAALLGGGAGAGYALGGAPMPWNQQRGQR